MDNIDTDKLIESEVMDRVMLDILEVLPEEAAVELTAITNNIGVEEANTVEELRHFLRLYSIDIDDIISRNRESVISEIESA